MSFSVKMWFTVLVAFAVVVSAFGQGDVASQCPSPNGFFADAVQCDKYYECVDDVLTEKLCPDGMGFNDLNPRVEKCDFLFQIDCSERPELQPAQPTDVCPRQNGYFPMADETNCNQFHYCASGTGNLITCPEALVFSLTTGTCVWPEEAGRSNCVAENLLNFTCPRVGHDAAISHPRYSDPHDCQYFYVCINGKTPRRNGCSFGQVFNSRTKTCDSPTEVPECADYYTEYFENYFDTLGGSSGRISADIIAAAVASGFNVPNLNTRQRIHTSSTQRRGTTESSNTALDANDSTSFKQTRGNVGEAAGAKPTRDRPTRRRITGSGARDRAVPGGESRDHTTTPSVSKDRFRRPSARRPSTTTTTTTTTPPPPPPADDYVYYDEPAYYDDYPAGAVADSANAPAPTEAPTEEAPKRRTNFRSSLLKSRS